MLYTILIYGSEPRVAQWTKEEESEVMGRHAALREDLKAAGRLGPVMRLSPDGARIVRKYKDRRFVTDGPFAETKEQLAGFYMIEAKNLDEAIGLAAGIPPACVGSIEVRPIRPIRETVAGGNTVPHEQPEKC